MKTILVISFSHLDRDPRVRRQLLLLAGAGYDVIAAGLSDPLIDGVKWWRISMPPKTLIKKILNVLLLKLHLYKRYYNSLQPVVDLLSKDRKNKNTFDLVIANDVESLPIGIKIASGAPVFLDSHEYSPEEWGGFVWKFVFSKYKDWQCRTYLPMASKMSTVCQGIADKYSKTYDVRSFITLNAPAYLDIKLTKVDENCICLVHHGAAQNSRGLDSMIDMMTFLDDEYELHFYLMASSTQQLHYLEYLKEKSAKLNKSIFFHEPVETSLISSEINQYDIGIYPLKPLSTNEKYSLPNKFFEFIQARLAIIIGPSVEMQKIVQDFNLGEVADDFTPESMAEKISSLSVDKIIKYKNNSDISARKLSFASQAPVFLEEIKKTLGELD